MNKQKGESGMKFVLVILLNTMLLSGVASAGEIPDLEAKKGKLSYSVGYQVGGDFVRQGKDINPEVLLKGIQDAMVGNEPLMTKKEMSTTLTNLQKSVAEAQKQKMLERAEINLAAGKAFLAENRKKDGIKTLPSGLQYKVVQKEIGRASCRERV